MKKLLPKNAAFFRTVLTSCFASVSSALLASSFTLFAPSAAVAFQLIDSDDDGTYEGVHDLDLFGDGSIWDVDFSSGTGTSVYSDGFDFTTRTEATEALAALYDLVPEVFVPEIGAEDSFGGGSVFSDIGQINVGFGTLEGSGFSSDSGQIDSVKDIILPQNNLPDIPLADPRTFLYARFSESSPQEGIKSTPEPNLIFGFVTLGGLMLGSKRKTKG